MTPPALRAAIGSAIGLSTLVLAACAPASTNLPDPAGPRHAGPLPGPVPSAAAAFRVVTFNLKEGREVETALALLRDEPALRDADLVLLQEMDEVGAEWIADGLGMAWVYYPATRRDGRGFGNAVLSRWPIRDDEKIVLPHLSVFRRSQRTATVATVVVRGVPVRVYSVHLATIINQSAGDRADQMRAVLAHAADAPRAIIGGDLNAENLGELAAAEGFAWPTRDGPRSTFLGRFDHLLFRGFGDVDGIASGIVDDARGASDHRPVWAALSLEKGSG